MLGRKPIWFNKERERLKKQLDELQKDVEVSKQKDVELLLGNLDFKTGMEVLSQVNIERAESLDSSLDSSEEEKLKVEDKKISPEKNQEKEDKINLYQAIINPQGIAAQDKIKQSKVNEDAAQLEVFEAIKKAYQSNFKYVTGCGQSQDDCLMLP